MTDEMVQDLDDRDAGPEISTYQIHIDDKSGIGGGLVYDGTDFGNIARFMNHACDPNCEIIKVECGLQYPTVAFFTKRSIAVGEELTWTYDKGGGKKKKDGVRCLCGAPQC